jgi:hypothetical protein
MSSAESSFRSFSNIGFRRRAARSLKSLIRSKAVLAVLASSSGNAGFQSASPHPASGHTPFTINDNSPNARSDLVERNCTRTRHPQCGGDFHVTVLAHALASLRSANDFCSLFSSTNSLRATNCQSSCRFSPSKARTLALPQRLGGRRLRLESVCRTCVAADRNMKEVEHETRPDS